MITMLITFFFLAWLWPIALANEPDHENHHHHHKGIEVDVLIVGGGSSGTYSAIRLHQQGKSVVVVEKEAVLGGHTNTYIDPVTKFPVNYGVQVFENIPVVTNYSAYLGVPLASLNLGSSPFVSYVADFSAGKVLPQSALPPTDLSVPLGGYIAQLAKYPYLNDGFNLPSPVPGDLLLRFGDFLSKYQIQALATISFQYNQGLGNVLQQSSLYATKVFNSKVVAGITTGFLTAASHDNHQIYDRALSVLGSAVLLNSTVKRLERHTDAVWALASTPSGNVKIKAKKLLITIPPKLENLQFLDLDNTERHLFGQFNNSYYWTSVVRNSGVPDNATINALSFTAPDGVPALPGTYSILATGLPGLHSVFYGSPYAISDDQVKKNILADIATAVKAGGFPPISGTPSFVAFKNHSPFELTVSTDAISSGFYNQLNSLQGHQQTYWTGAAWQAHDSSLIWNFTEYNVLPKILK